VGSSGETPQRAAVDHIETNPRKLPQLRSLNPQEQRVIETAHTTNLFVYICGGIGRHYIKGVVPT